MSAPDLDDAHIRRTYVVESQEDGGYAIESRKTCTRHKARCGCPLHPEVIAGGLSAEDVCRLIESAAMEIRMTIPFEAAEHGART
jgi:hypothetical protein